MVVRQILEDRPSGLNHASWITELDMNTNNTHNSFFIKTGKASIEGRDRGTGEQS